MKLTEHPLDRDKPGLLRVPAPPPARSTLIALSKETRLRIQHPPCRDNTLFECNLEMHSTLLCEGKACVAMWQAEFPRCIL